jgi:UDP-3-O-[3-hydroxymyristoyl] N-acetylglucosamine deacetylase
MIDKNTANKLRHFDGIQQTTISSPVVLHGRGVHTGALVSVTLMPAGAGSGIVFRRCDCDAKPINIAASFKAITNANLCTVLGNRGDLSITTVEHLLAAIRGLNIDNVMIEVDGAEVPIMDGSSAAFVEAIDKVGICELNAPRWFIKVLKTVGARNGRSWGELRPHAGFYLDVEINYDCLAIGHQRRALEMTPDVFRADVSRARTFGFAKDAEVLWASGRAIGSSLENTIAIRNEQIVNPEGLRYSDEFVRHKMLDAVGDLALAGAPMLCAYHSSRGGHSLNHGVLKALFADRTAWTTIEASSVCHTNHVTGLRQLSPQADAISS